MAAQHLAAILIQRNFRRYMGLRRGMKMLKSNLQHPTLASPVHTASPIGSGELKGSSPSGNLRKSKITALGALQAKF